MTTVNEDGCSNGADTINGENIMEFLSSKVHTLYYYRDHYFENHSLEDVVNRNQNIEKELKNVLILLDEYRDLAENTNRARYYYLRGRTLNVVPLYNKEAEDILSKAIKLDPKFVDAWNELGECYWKNDNFTEAVNCFEKALLYQRNKISLRSLSMLCRQKNAVTQEERQKNFEIGLTYAKEAVQLDPHDGHSWTVLGNAHLSSFFGISQNPKTLKQCLSAYSQAEKDIVANTTPDLHYNKAITLKYEEEFKLAIESFKWASIYDPNWDPPRIKQNQLIKYLDDINELVSTCGKMKMKRLTQILSSIDSKQLGPYSGGSYTSSNGQTVKLQEVMLKQLQQDLNEEKVVLGKVVCSVRNEDTLPFTFCMVDKEMACVVITVYNLAEGKGVIIGDSIGIPEPYVTDVNFQHGTKVYKFRLIRVETPLVLVVNGKKLTRDKQAGVQMSIFKKFD